MSYIQHKCYMLFSSFPRPFLRKTAYYAPFSNFNSILHYERNFTIDKLYSYRADYIRSP